MIGRIDLSPTGSKSIRGGGVMTMYIKIKTIVSRRNMVNRHLRGIIKTISKGRLRATNKRKPRNLRRKIVHS
jgi:hypothetical protein